MFDSENRGGKADPYRMTGLHDDSDSALREGLRALPAPEPSTDFEPRVLAALRTPEPWWRIVLPRIRPLISGVACSLILTVVLAQWALHAPESRTQAVSTGARSAVAVDEVLDHGDLRGGSLARLSGDRREAIPPPRMPSAAPPSPKHPAGQSRTQFTVDGNA